MAKYSERVMRILRCRDGLEGGDTRHDEQLRKLLPIAAFREICGWEMGSPSWATTIIDWLDSVGLKVVEKDAQR